MGTIKELQEEMQKLSSQIATVLSVSKYRDYYDLSGIEYSTNYTSGSGIEFLINEEVLGEDGHFTEVPAWRTSTVEHNGTDYFIVGFKDIDMNGLRVRVRSR